MKILYLFPFDLWNRKMSAGRALYGEAMTRQPGVTVKFSGSGWPGYDDRLSVAKNLNGEQFNATLFYKPDRLMLPNEAPGVRFIVFNECHGETYINDALTAAVHLVVFHHQSDRTLHEARLRALGIKSVSMLHAAPAEFYEPCRRSVDCLVTGVQSQEIYPLRFRFKKLVESGRLPGKVRGHPGYRLSCHADVRRQYAEYAKALCGAKVTLACTSKHSYALAKLVEGFMAGCCVVTDTPDDDLFREHFQPGVHYVEARGSDSEIVRDVRRVLDNGDWERIGNAARAVALEHFTMDRYAERLVGEMRALI